MAVSPEDILVFGGPQSLAIMHGVIDDEGLDKMFENTAVYFGTTSGPVHKEALRFLVQGWYKPKPGS